MIIICAVYYSGYANAVALSYHLIIFIPVSLASTISECVVKMRCVRERERESERERETSKRISRV